MPFQGEHSCRLNDPKKYPKIRRVNCDQKKDGKCIDVIYGIIKPKESEIQALRFSTKVWTKADAKKVCKDRGGTFEAAAPPKEKKELDMKQTEVRTIDGVEWRVEKDDDKPIRLVGYAALFNILSLPMFCFRERILKGAFTKSLKAGDDVRALVDHNPSQLLGRRSSKTLKLTEDKKGLLAEIDLPNTTVAKDVTELVERGDLTGMSIGFKTISDRWHIEEGQEVRELLEIQLRDVSVVTFPAYPDTDVAVRSHDLWQEQEQESRGSVDIAKRRLDLAEIE